MSHKRCPHCGLNPLPTDVAFFWGESITAQAEPMCRYCRGRFRKDAAREAKERSTTSATPTMPMKQLHAPRSGTRTAVVVLVQKLIDMPSHLLTEYFLGQSLRDTLRLRTYSCDCFLTDGERLWPWEYYPHNRETPLDWGTFQARYPEWDLWQPTESGIEKIPEEQEVTGFEHIMM